jgi:hypothetical protein
MCLYSSWRSSFLGQVAVPQCAEILNQLTCFADLSVMLRLVVFQEGKDGIGIIPHWPRWLRMIHATIIG